MKELCVKNVKRRAMKNYKTKQLREMLIYKLEKEIKNNLFQLNKAF